LPIVLEFYILCLLICTPFSLLCDSNALLTKPKLVDAVVHALEVVMPDARGLAYFNHRGALTPAAALTLDAQGRLQISDIHSSVSMHGHRLRDVVLEGANLTRVGSIHTAALVLEEFAQDRIRTGTGEGAGGESGAGGEAELQHAGSLLALDASGRVRSTAGALTVLPGQNTVVIQSLQAASLAGNLDAKHHTLSNAHLRGGQLQDVAKIGTQELTVGRLKSDVAGSARVVLVNSDGEVLANANADEVVTIANLAVGKIQYLSDEIDFGNKILRNIQLDTESFRLGAQESVLTEKLTVSALDIGLRSADGANWKNEDAPSHAAAKDATSTDRHSVDVVGQLLASDSSGQVGAIPGAFYSNGVFNIETSRVRALSLQAQQLTLPTLPSGSLLATEMNGSGNLVAAADINVPSITVGKKVVISHDAKMQLQGVAPSSLLAVNAAGEVVALQKKASNKEDDDTFDASLHRLQANTLVAEELRAQKINVQRLVMGTVTAGDLATSTTQGGSFLIQHAVRVFCSFIK
jgi:hypothetical protein